MNALISPTGLEFHASEASSNPSSFVQVDPASHAKIYMSKYSNILKEVQWGGDLKIGIRQIRGLTGLGRTTMLHAKVSCLAHHAFHDLTLPFSVL